LGQHRGGVSYEDMRSQQQQSLSRGKKRSGRGGQSSRSQAEKLPVAHLNQSAKDVKGACMQVGEVLAIKTTGAVVSMGKDSDEKAFIPGWAHRNVKYKGNFLTTTQGVELAINDLITFCIDPSVPETDSFKYVGCNVTVLKHGQEEVRINGRI